MIKHHPTFELLQSYVNGELPASLAAGISIHAQMCPVCQAQIAQLTDNVAEQLFEQSFAPSCEPSLEKYAAANEATKLTSNDTSEMFNNMINAITASSDTAPMPTQQPKTINFRGKEYSLPAPLHHVTRGKPAHIGKLTRSRLQLDEGEIHTSLLHISPGGGVPEHTHKGFELTLLLDGEFSDELGDYVPGDFIMLNGKHQHNPISANGCLCYTVANDAIHFTKGINKLLNPIGAFIY